MAQISARVCLLPLEALQMFIKLFTMGKTLLLRCFESGERAILRSSRRCVASLVFWVQGVRVINPVSLDVLLRGDRLEALLSPKRRSLPGSYNGCRVDLSGFRLDGAREHATVPQETPWCRSPAFGLLAWIYNRIVT
jgi:hypothetical protein